jgi:hypothetical protein
MGNRFRCACRRCTIRSLTGPAVVITIGVLFLLDQMRGDYFSFSNTWPIILLVIGAIQLASAVSSSEGHMYGPVPPSPPGTMPPPPQNPFPGQGQGQ